MMSKLLHTVCSVISCTLRYFLVFCCHILIVLHGLLVIWGLVERNGTQSWFSYSSQVLCLFHVFPQTSHWRSSCSHECFAASCPCLCFAAVVRVCHMTSFFHFSGGFLASLLDGCSSCLFWLSVISNYQGVACFQGPSCWSFLESMCWSFSVGHVLVVYPSCCRILHCEVGLVLFLSCCPSIYQCTHELNCLCFLPMSNLCVLLGRTCNGFQVSCLSASLSPQ